MRRIALFGGAFDPPHFGHVQCVTNVLNSGYVDEVWCVPSGGSRYDKYSPTDPAHRLSMLELVRQNEFFGSGRMRIEPIQVNADQDSCATIDLVDSMKRLHPDGQFYFVIGSDNVEGLRNWKESKRLLKEVQFIVVWRGLDEQQFPGEHLLYLEREKSVVSDISSSIVRELLSKGGETAGVLPSSVRNFIKDQQLYQKKAES